MEYRTRPKTATIFWWSWIFVGVVAETYFLFTPERGDVLTDQIRWVKDWHVAGWIAVVAFFSWLWYHFVIED